ncbi:outer membrane lipoprotein-sorting protein [Anaerobaca lacustris]|uniref:Outer membrane lipoprotein-sorting protein n=1 Tax=Anaerobaca lacustris TaxID=3044600 RepID=A0AAW6U362_9BACT|nr:outer membrane lipoprotein-sorting protein [Sedimentisphaerales bacterium M17dextr]
MRYGTCAWAVALMALGAARLLPAAEPSPEERGLAIATEADRRERGYGDSTANLRMVLRNKQGQTSERELRIRTLEVENDGTRSLCIFDTPPDVKGTILLTHAHKEADDDQWLFLPALRRIRRIAAQNKSGSFMGSEFSYEDIATQELGKHTYRWLRDEVYDGNDCYVIERTPVDKANSGYSRQVAWLDKEHYRTWKVDYYDRKNDLLKTLTFKDYRKYAERFWRATRMDMVNHQTGKSTILTWSDFTFGTGLREIDFDRNSLTLLR